MDKYTLPVRFGNNLEYDKYLPYQSTQGVTLHLKSSQALRKLALTLGVSIESVFSHDGLRELRGKNLLHYGKVVGMAFPERNGEFAVTVFSDFLGL